MFTLLLVILLSNGTIQAAPSPKPFPSMESCTIAVAKIDEAIKTEGMNQGVVGYRLECIKISKETFKTPNSGKEG